jgi:CRP/FNR family transcriptional regulator, cyclic AMP receptor protein
MSNALECCRQLPEVQLKAGDVLLAEGTSSGKLYVLIEGEAQVLRGDIEVARVCEPGSVFGEMAVLLGEPHSATVKAHSDVRLHVVEDPQTFLLSSPELMLHVGKLLALRLKLANGYLADVKSQYAESGDHLCMVDTVLECLLHQQEAGFSPGVDDDGDPRT